MRDDLYQLLDVSSSATQEEIKAAYRRQAMKYHPDRNGGNSAAEERFKAVVEAYRILGDPQEREAYDANLERDRKYADAPELAAMRRHIRVSARHGRERRENRGSQKRRNERECAYPTRPRLFFIGRRKKVSMWHLLAFYAAALALFLPAITKSCQVAEQDAAVAGTPAESQLTPEEIKARALDMVSVLRTRAEEGDTNAQLRLGLILYAGTGTVEPDRAAAREWWQKAADKGNARAKEYLERYTNTAPPPEFDPNAEVIRAAEQKKE